MDMETHVVKNEYATTAARLRADGFSPSAIARAVRRGLLAPVRRGAYVRPAQHEEGMARAAVAVARTLPGSVLTHANAAAAWGLPVLAPSTHRFTLARAGQGKPSTSGSRDLIIRDLAVPTRELPRWPDVDAVCPADAAVQLAARDLTAGVTVADAALHAQLIDPSDLAAAARRAVGWGAEQARRLPELCDPRTESPGESVTRLGLLGLGVQVRPQVSIHDHRGFVGRVDFLDEVHRIVYEFDGNVKYEGAHGTRALIKEKRREDRLSRAGYVVVRLTWGDVRDPSRLHRIVCDAQGLAQMRRRIAS